jgi:hypothetical protein
MTDFVRPMFAQPSRHRKRCDMSRCTNFAAIDFSRCGGNIGKLDLCQDCIDEIAKYATKQEPASLKPVKPANPANPANPAKSPLKCQYCGRLCGGELGLKSHEKYCKERL